MGTNVFINGREASSRAAGGKSIAAFPDPCWSPPSPPAGPVVIPYPNTAKAKDLKNGTTTVFIKGSPVAVEDKSYFSTSVGDEPATKAFPQGVVSHTIKGKAYFASWSMNVKFEGRGVSRHGDLMTHNHGSMGANTPPMYYLDNVDVAKLCAENFNKIDEECKSDDPEKGWLSHCGPLGKQGAVNSDNADAMAKFAKNDSCLGARKCALVPFNKTKNAEKGEGCCPSQTGHHLLPDAMFRSVDTIEIKRGFLAWVAAYAGKKLKSVLKMSDMPRDKKPCTSDWPKYNEGDGPTICLEGTNGSMGSHGRFHSKTEKKILKYLEEGRATIPFSKAKTDMAQLVSKEYNCDEECIAAQLNAAYKDMTNKELNETEVMSHAGVAGHTKQLQKIIDDAAKLGGRGPKK